MAKLREPRAIRGPSSDVGPALRMLNSAQRIEIMTTKGDLYFTYKMRLNKFHVNHIIKKYRLLFKHHTIPSTNEWCDINSDLNTLDLVKSGKALAKVFIFILLLSKEAMMVDDAIFTFGKYSKHATFINTFRILFSSTKNTIHKTRNIKKVESYMKVTKSDATTIVYTIFLRTWLTYQNYQQLINFGDSLKDAKKEVVHFMLAESA